MMKFEAFIQAFGTRVACRENTVRVQLELGMDSALCVEICPRSSEGGACGSCCVYMKIAFAVCSTKWTELKLLPVTLFFLSYSL